MSEKEGKIRGFRDDDELRAGAARKRGKKGEKPGNLGMKKS